MKYLTEEEELMLDAVKEFCESEVRPRIDEIESDTYPSDLYARMVELGLPTFTLPTEYGGLSGRMVAKVAMEAELSKANMTVGMSGMDCSVASLIVKTGTEEHKKLYLPDLMDAPGGFGFTEPGAGSDSSAMQTTAVKDGDEWVINGQKTFISFCKQAKVFLVSARTNETGEGGISTFLVRHDDPGFKIGSVFHKLGMHGSDTGELFFEDLRVPAVAMIGVENKGLHGVLALLDEARIGIAAVALGLAQEALDKAIEFSKQRVAFGGPIAAKQGIQWYIADMATKVEAAKTLLYQTARMFDEGERITTAAAMAKYYCTQVALDVTNKAVSINGGYGLMRDNGVERLYRDAKMCSIIEGTDEIMKVVISRAYLR